MNTCAGDYAQNGTIGTILMQLAIDICICSTAIESLCQIMSYWEQIIESELAES